MTSLHYRIGKGTTGSHVDLALIKANIPFSRRKVRRLLDSGCIYRNGVRVRTASTIVRAGDVIRVDVLETAQPSDANQQTQEQQRTPLTILLHKNGLLALNKPPGLLSEATEKGGVKDVHVIKLLQEECPQLGRSLHLCHRLDRETSGILLVATTTEKAAYFNELFRERGIKKTYLALCYGLPQKKHWNVNCYLSPIDRQTGRVSQRHSGGRPSQSTFALVSYSAEHDISLIRCHPHTGRSHQLRVHLAMSGVPIVGDKKYGEGSKKPLSHQMLKLAAQHQMLHAYSLALPVNPGEAETLLKAPPPENFIALAKLANVFWE